MPPSNTSAAVPGVTASLNFVIPPPDGAPAYQKINAAKETGVREKNFALAAHEVSVHDLRAMGIDSEDSVTLDTAGFELVRSPARHTCFSDDASIMKEYYAESVELIKKRTGAARVIIFDHTIRRRRPGQLDDSPDRRQPLAQAHLDQTPISALARVHKHVPSAELPTLLGKRFQILNFWRPIHHPAHDWPLALCDFRSFDPEDLILVSLVYPDRVGETYGVKYNSKQRWVYFSGLEPEDAILIKCYDSLQDGSTALYGPHTAFCDPKTPADAPLRESIELRALVFYN